MFTQRRPYLVDLNEHCPEVISQGRDRDCGAWARLRLHTEAKQHVTMSPVIPRYITFIFNSPTLQGGTAMNQHKAGHLQLPVPRTTS